MYSIRTRNNDNDNNEKFHTSIVAYTMYVVS
jgi:hypothetical protein